MIGLEVEDTKLVPRNGDTKARGLETKRILDVDTVVFCIGDKVDDDFGLPIQWNEFVKHPEPEYPVNGVSFEAFDHEAEQPVEGVFVAGWSREASSGLVGVARKDGENGAEALSQYLEKQAPVNNTAEIFEKLEQALNEQFEAVVSKQDIKKLEEVEADEAQKLGVEVYKMKSNEEMLAAISR